MACRQDIDRKRKKYCHIAFFSYTRNIISLNPFISDISARKQIYVASGDGYTLPYIRLSYFSIGPLPTEAYIRHHLLHKSARKILFSSRNVRNKWIKRNNIKSVRKKCDMTVFLNFSCQYLVNKPLK